MSLYQTACACRRTTRMSHDEERARSVRLKPQPDRAPRHWLDPLVRRKNVHKPQNPRPTPSRYRTDGRPRHCAPNSNSALCAFYCGHEHASPRRATGWTPCLFRGLRLPDRFRQGPTLEDRGGSAGAGQYRFTRGSLLKRQRGSCRHSCRLSARPGSFVRMANRKYQSPARDDDEYSSQ